MSDKPQAPPQLALAGELSKIDRLRQLLGADAEPQLILDTVEGETDVLEMMDAIVETILGDEDLAGHARERARKIEQRADRRRAIVLQIMERIGTRSARRPLYTASIADGPKAVHITDPASIPLPYQRLSPDKPAIGKALKDGTAVPGAELNNGPPVLRILR